MRKDYKVKVIANQPKIAEYIENEVNKFLKELSDKNGKVIDIKLTSTYLGDRYYLVMAMILYTNKESEEMLKHQSILFKGYPFPEMKEKPREKRKRAPKEVTYI